MKVKSFFFIAFVIIFAMVIYFLTNPSYEKSLEAKFYYETGDFKQAYQLSKEAFQLNNYNKMAATIMTQSQYSLKYVNYINDAKRYIKEIEKTIKNKEVTDKDRAKIRMISKIMIDRYKKLAPSVVVDKELIQEAQAYYEKFQKLLKKAHRIL